MGRGSQTTLKKNDRGSRMTWHEDDDISSETNDTFPRNGEQQTEANFKRFKNVIHLLYVCVFQYPMTVSRRPAALCEHRRSPPWSSWWSSPVSVTTSVWAWAPSPPAHLAPSQASSSGSQPWTDSTPSAAGTHLTGRIPAKVKLFYQQINVPQESPETCWSVLIPLLLAQLCWAH